MSRIAAMALAILVSILGGFYAGDIVGQQKAAPSSAFAEQPGRQASSPLDRLGACPAASAAPGGSAGGSGRGGAPAVGTITTLSNGTLTVHDARCNTDVKVTFADSVIVRKTVTGQTSDLQENQTVTIVGQRQPDGSLRANSITIVPAGTGLPGSRN